jgi:hypothetical protein
MRDSQYMDMIYSLGSGFSGLKDMPGLFPSEALNECGNSTDKMIGYCY